MRTFFAKKRVKVGNDYVLQDFEVDIYQLEQNGLTLEERLARQDVKIKKLTEAIEKFIRSVGGVK